MDAQAAMPPMIDAAAVSYLLQCPYQDVRRLSALGRIPAPAVDEWGSQPLWSREEITDWQAGNAARDLASIASQAATEPAHTCHTELIAST